jgi:beta-glucosidase
MQRRSFLKVGTGVAAALALPSAFASKTAASTPGTAPPNTRRFPEGFLWGTATASYQVEGGAREEGRAPSIWDTFSEAPGNTHNGDNGDIADDFFHRYKEDVALMKSLGVNGCRFSIAWSRVFPQGAGQANPKGLDFYHRLLDELQHAGIVPYCTLYHWDLPQALQDKFGGWRSKDTGKAFADYCGYTVGKLSNRIANFMTMNEMSAFVYGGYQDGHFAPGIKSDAATVAAMSHNVVLAHGMAVQAIRAAGNASTRVGLASNAVSTTPLLETADHIAATRTAFREENAPFLTVLMEGRYTDAYLKTLGPAAPKHTAEELSTIASPMDFLGLNVYYPTYIRASSAESGYELVKPPSTFPHMQSEWLTIGPECLYWTPKLAAETWKLKSIFITENGCSADDQFAHDGQIYDSDRIMYLRNYLTQLQRATADGIPVKGYFVWSLLDNFEWSSGYAKRFGLTYVDYRTQKRTPKTSFAFYRNVIAENAVV